MRVEHHNGQSTVQDADPDSESESWITPGSEHLKRLDATWVIAQFRMLTLTLSGFITRRVMMPGDLKRMASRMQHFKYGMVAKESSVTGEKNKTKRHRDNNSLITATCTQKHTTQTWSWQKRQLIMDSQFIWNLYTQTQFLNNPPT